MAVRGWTIAAERSQSPSLAIISYESTTDRNFLDTAFPIL